MYDDLLKRLVRAIETRDSSMLATVLAGVESFDRKYLFDASRRNRLYPVLEAARYDWVEAIDRLNEFGFSLKVTDPDGCSALMYACNHGSATVAQRLLDLNVTLEEADHHGWQAIHSASAQGHADIVRKLVDKGQCVDSVTRDGQTPLQLASQEGWS